MAAIVDKEKCTGCKSCVEVCSVDAIKIENDKAVISDECVECGVCVNECPSEAISLSGR
jgi:NAD-dependent dihydropyrimidine dehydrogenase PreA subunit